MSVRRWRSRWWRRANDPADPPEPVIRHGRGHGSYGRHTHAVYTGPYSGGGHHWAHEPTATYSTVGRAGDLTPARAYRASGGQRP